MLLILLCTATLLGLAVGDLGPLDTTRLAATAGLSLIGAALAGPHLNWRLAALMACAAAVAAIRASTVTIANANAVAQQAAVVEPYFGTTVTIQATVTQPPTPSSSGASLLFLVDAQRIDGVRVPTRNTGFRLRVVADPILATHAEQMGCDALALSATLPPPETVVLEGRLLPSDGGGPPALLFPSLLGCGPVNPAETSARDAIDQWLQGVRHSARQNISAALPQPQASLAAGILLGGSGQLDQAVRRDLQRSGLAHLLAIDGFKMIVVAATLNAVLGQFVGPRLALLPTWAVLTGYTVLTGAHASAIRAALMVGLAGAAAMTGRRADPLTSLLLACAVMATVEPPLLLDLGLQLSLSATLGLVLLWPRLRRLLRRVRVGHHRLPRLIVEPAGLTVAVTLATLPVQLSVFQAVSLISPVAHILAVPLLAPVMLSATVLSCGAPIGWLGTSIAAVPIRVLTMIVLTLGELPSAALSTGRLPIGAALTLAGILLAWGVWWLPDMRDVRRRALTWTIPRRLQRLRLLAILTTLPIVLYVVRPDGHVHVVTLNAGSRAEALFIRGPTGRTALITRGKADPVLLATEVADHLLVWEHKLDISIAVDRLAGDSLITTLARYPADLQLSADTDQRIDLGGGAVLDIFADPSDHRRGLILTHGQSSLPLLTRTASSLSPATPVAVAIPVSSEEQKTTRSGQPRPLL